MGAWTSRESHITDKDAVNLQTSRNVRAAWHGSCLPCPRQLPQILDIKGHSMQPFHTGDDLLTALPWGRKKTGVHSNFGSSRLLVALHKTNAHSRFRR